MSVLVDTKLFIVDLPLFLIRSVRQVGDLPKAPGTVNVSQTLINSCFCSLAMVHALPSRDQLTNKVILSSAALLFEQCSSAEAEAEAITSMENSHGNEPEDRILHVYQAISIDYKRHELQRSWNHSSPTSVMASWLQVHENEAVDNVHRWEIASHSRYGTSGYSSWAIEERCSVSLWAACLLVARRWLCVSFSSRESFERWVERSRARMDEYLPTIHREHFRKYHLGRSWTDTRNRRICRDESRCNIDCRTRVTMNAHEFECHLLWRKHRHVNRLIQMVLRWNCAESRRWTRERDHRSCWRFLFQC